LTLLFRCSLFVLIGASIGWEGARGICVDTLGYAKRLRDSGIPEQQAEAHAEAARTFIMTELVTKTDLQAAMATMRSDFQAALALTKAELQGAIVQLDAKLDRSVIQLDHRIDKLSLTLTVRLGVLLVAGIGALAALMKLS
jgi:hypothetical protein